MTKLSDIPDEIRKMTTVFARELETDKSHDEYAIASDTAKLLRHAALLGWAEGGDDTQSSASLALAHVSTTSGALQEAAGSMRGSIVGVSTRVAYAVEGAKSKGELKNALSGLVSEISDARTALNDHAVSAIAGGSPCRCVVILGVDANGGIGHAEEAVVEAAGSMDQLRVMIVSFLMDGGAAANAMRMRLEEVEGLDVEVVDVRRVLQMFHERRVHAVLLDACAVESGRGVIAPCGSAVVATAARLASVRVFVLTVAHHVLPAGSDAVGVLQAAREHPGVVLPYDVAHDTMRHIEVVHPTNDFIPMQSVDVLVSSSGIQPAW